MLRRSEVNTTSYVADYLTRSVRCASGFVLVGQPECAGINRHVVGDERALQERKQRIHPGLESCRRYREVALEA